MVTAILDTNVFIRAALRPNSPSARVVDAYLDGNFQLVLSQAVLQELLTVLLLPEIRAVHGWSDDKILEFVMNLPAGAAFSPVKPLYRPVCRGMLLTRNS
jgi:predicted nucleic acid-binding protein